MTASSDPSSLHWFVACVKSCQERKTEEALARMGVECYVPLQREMRQWSDRRKLVERLVIPRIVFIKCTEQERRRIVSDLWQIHAFMFDRGDGRPAIVRDSEMELFRRMVENGEGQVNIHSSPLASGDRVVVVTGPLSGLECELVSVEGRRCIAMRLGIVGTATMDLPADSVRKVVLTQNKRKKII